MKAGISFLFRIPGAHHLGTSYPQLDLAVLSLCDHLVIDFGTFGLWVSYEGELEGGRNCGYQIWKFVQNLLG